MRGVTRRGLVLVLGIVVMTAGVGVGVSATGPAGADGWLPDSAETDSATGTSVSAQAPAPPSDGWTVLVNDSDSDTSPVNLDVISAQSTNETLYFKATYAGEFDVHDDVDTAFFIDADRDVTTGLNNTTVGWYYMDDIGADYAAVVGEEGDAVWQWDADANTWGSQNYANFSYVDVDPEADTVVIGVNRSHIDDPDEVDLLIGNAQTVPWDWAPDKGEGHVTFNLTEGSADDGDDSDEPSVNGTLVEVEPAEDSTSVDGSTTIDIVVDNIDNGVGAYNVSLAVNDTGVATVTAATDEAGLQFLDLNIANDNSSVVISGAGAETADTGPVTIATVTLSGQAPGSATLDLTVNVLGNEGGESYDIGAVRDGVLTVENETGPPPVVGDNPPTDPDGDGAHEDVNGDGTMNVIDVQALFANLDSDAIQNNPEAFDFNGDGTVNVIDVQALFVQVA